jgi:hypothetical protein
MCACNLIYFCWRWEEEGTYIYIFKHTHTHTQIEIVNKRTEERIVLTDILFGDVWLCSGQSNMQMTVSQCLNAEDEGIYV